VLERQIERSGVHCHLAVDMLRIRYRTLFVVLILILLIVSLIFGLLTYWLEPELSTDPGPGLGSMTPWGLGASHAGRTALCRLDLAE
jgi:hypothetical protein